LDERCGLLEAGRRGCPRLLWGVESVSDLDTLRDMVKQDLDDTGNDVWSTDDIDRAIKRALIDYSQVRPQEAVTTIELPADGREVDISSISGLTRVVKVWYPYDSSAAESPPRWVQWDKWAQTLYISSGDEPAGGKTVRIYYQKQHTIEGLDGASETTVPAEDEEVLIAGAGAYASLQKARGSVGEAGVSTETPEHWLGWGINRMAAFNEALRRVRTRELRRIDKRIPLHREGWTLGGVENGI
jgi:hypothetical protein